MKDRDRQLEGAPTPQRGIVGLTSPLSGPLQTPEWPPQLTGPVRRARDQRSPAVNGRST